jgi:hypothetical protein
MDTQPPPQGESGSNTGRLAFSTSNQNILATQQERRHKLVHRNANNAAPKPMTLVEHLKIVRKTGSSKNKMLHGVGCESIHIKAMRCQLSLKYTPGVGREVSNEFIAAHDCNAPLASKADFRTVRKIEHHDLVRAGNFTDVFPEKHRHKCMKQACITLDESMEAYMIDVTAEIHCHPHQLMSWRLSTGLPLWP